MRTAKQIIESISLKSGCLTEETVIIPQAVRLIIRKDTRPSYPDTTIILIEVTACPDARIIRSCPSETGVILRQLEAILTPATINHLLQQAVEMLLADVRVLSEKSLMCHDL
jgi:hypothetical protein